MIREMTPTTAIKTPSIRRMLREKPRAIPLISAMASLHRGQAFKGSAEGRKQRAERRFLIKHFINNDSGD
jgi:hypothetical protein